LSKLCQKHPNKNNESALREKDAMHLKQLKTLKDPTAQTATLQAAGKQPWSWNGEMICSSLADMAPLRFTRCWKMLEFSGLRGWGGQSCLRFPIKGGNWMHLRFQCDFLEQI
jgi:hypothetical protein